MKTMMTAAALTLASTLAFAAPVSEMSVHAQARQYACGDVATKSTDDCVMSMLGEVERTQQHLIAKPGAATLSDYVMAYLPLAGALQVAPPTQTVTDVAQRLQTLVSKGPAQVALDAGSPKGASSNEAWLTSQLEKVTSAQKTYLHAPTWETATTFDRTSATLIGALAVAERSQAVPEIEEKLRVLMTEVANAESTPPQSFEEPK